MYSIKSFGDSLGTISSLRTLGVNDFSDSVGSTNSVSPQLIDIAGSRTFSISAQQLDNSIIFNSVALTQIITIILPTYDELILVYPNTTKLLCNIMNMNTSQNLQFFPPLSNTIYFNSNVNSSNQFVITQPTQTNPFIFTSNNYWKLYTNIDTVRNVVQYYIEYSGNNQY